MNQVDETVQEVQRWFIEHHKTLSAAESCTGGALASTLTRSPGASRYFLGSMVVYSNEIKTKVLGVPRELFEQYGAVSQQVVEAMAKGVLDLTGSDFAVAVSGIAGPTGGSVLKPVGTIWGCIGSRQGLLHSWRFHVKGNREKIISHTVKSLLLEIIDELN